MENISLSPHGIKRLNQRLEIRDYEACKAMADRAFRNGKAPEAFTGRMGKYLAEVNRRGSTDKVIKIHSKNCYIFSPGGNLITVFSLAEKYDEYMYNVKPYKMFGGDDDFAA